MASLDGTSETPVEDISTDDHEYDHDQLPAAAEGIDRAEMAAQLSGATSAIAGQLQMITEEMNRLRSEIYSDNGLGSIKKELEQLRSGGALSPGHTQARECFLLNPSTHSRRQVWSRCRRSWRALRPLRHPWKDQVEAAPAAAPVAVPPGDHCSRHGSAVGSQLTTPLAEESRSHRRRAILSARRA